MNNELYVRPNPAAYSLAQAASGVLAALVFRRRFIRNEIKDVKGPYVVVANHQASLDFVNLIGATKKRLTFVISNSFYNSLPVNG
ncbi:MAG: hypothetical protein HUJ66_01415, partial [Oscillospiraceae bacterium]|nr:hypothetical protein [Oscillospiraceae bacterium]